MKKLLLYVVTFMFLVGCGGSSEQSAEQTTSDSTVNATPTEVPSAEESTSAETPTSTGAVNEAEDWMCVPGQRVGKITQTTSEAQLIELYLPENVVTEEMPIGEGQSLQVTKVYPNTPNEATIIWKEGEELQTPERVLIEQANTAWVTPEGITVGTTLEELEKLNEGPFKLLGFEWEYAGTVTSWEGGALAEPLAIGKVFTLQLASDKAPGDSYGEIIGEEEFDSDLPAIRDRELKVTSMGILFQ